MKELIVGLVQHSCTTDRDANPAKSVSGIREAASQGAGLIVLQELHLGPYFCQIKTQPITTWPNRFPDLPPRPSENLPGN